MKKYPIAEIFTSPQGEGLYTGTLMTFIRFAGCSVGKKIKNAERNIFANRSPDFHSKGLELVEDAPKVLETTVGGIALYTEKCTTYDGREFLCDTDFRTKEVLTTEEILARVPEGVQHLCLTGGEPLNQPLKEFLDYVEENTEYETHLETSGTVDIETKVDNWLMLSLWITVSPKLGVLDSMVEAADEIKLLIDENFDLSKVPEKIRAHSLVFIQPINDEFALSQKNMKLCLQLQKENPTWRISSQAHKLWNCR